MSHHRSLNKTGWLLPLALLLAHPPTASAQVPELDPYSVVYVCTGTGLLQAVSREVPPRLLAQVEHQLGGFGSCDMDPLRDRGVIYARMWHGQLMTTHAFDAATLQRRPELDIPGPPFRDGAVAVDPWRRLLYVSAPFSLFAYSLDPATHGQQVALLDAQRAGELVHRPLAGREPHEKRANGQPDAGAEKQFVHRVPKPRGGVSPAARGPRV